MKNFRDLAQDIVIFLVILTRCGGAGGFTRAFLATANFGRQRIP